MSYMRYLKLLIEELLEEIEDMLGALYTVFTVNVNTERRTHA